MSVYLSIHSFSSSFFSYLLVNFIVATVNKIICSFIRSCSCASSAYCCKEMPKRDAMLEPAIC